MTVHFINYVLIDTFWLLKLVLHRWLSKKDSNFTMFHQRSSSRSLLIFQMSVLEVSNYLQQICISQLQTDEIALMK